MPTNVFLVRWKDGWHEVVDAASVAVHPRHEAFLALGALQSIPEVDRVAGMQLSVVAHPRVAVAADHDPIDLSDRPYRSYNVGDIITVPNYGTGTSGQRVRAITGAEDENGEVTYSPELGDLLLEEQERMMLAVKKMSDGTLEGESPVAQPTRVYTPAIMAKPVPRVKTGGLKIVSHMTNYPNPQSESINEIGGLTVANLTEFRVTPENDGPIDGTFPMVSLWNHVGGDGDWEAARVDLGYLHNGGQTYVGTISGDSGTAELQFGDFYGISFRTNGNVSNAYVEAIFHEPGQTYTVSWGSE